MEFVKAENDEQIKSIEKLARIIWNEHYIGNLGQNQIDYMLDKFQSFKAIKDVIYKNNYIYYLFCKEGSRFGYMAFQPEGSRLFLSKLYILKEYRGNGYSKRAIKFIEEYCANTGIDTIWLTCNKHNTSSLQAYKKLGFRITDEAVTDIGNGYVMDDYILQKYL